MKRARRAGIWLVVLFALCAPACGGSGTSNSAHDSSYIDDAMKVMSRFRRDTLSASDIAALQVAYARVVSDWATLEPPQDLKAVQDELAHGFVRANETLSRWDATEAPTPVNVALQQEFIFPATRDWSDAITAKYNILVRFTGGPSMQPTFCSGDGIKFSRFDGHATRFAIVMTEPMGDLAGLIKRIVALPGETVEIKDGSVYVDSVRLDDPYGAEAPGYVMKAVTLEPDEFFLLGDNRNDSHDSHDSEVGAIRSNQIAGIADKTTKGTCP